MSPTPEGSRPVTAAAILFVALAPSLAGFPNPPFRPRIQGYVEIAGQLADVGTTVQIVVFRSSKVFFVCGETTVHKVRDSRGAAYDADIKQTPECLNPDNLYDFYVNGVHAGAARFHFNTTYTENFKNIAVPAVALKTPADSGVMLLWFYGQVKDELGRGAPKGTRVTAEARGAPCKGTGETSDLYWVPQDPIGQRMGVLGFYWIGVPLTAGCEDRQLLFDVYAGHSRLKGTAMNIHTPPYGKAVPANLTLKP
ncbi:MAG: hypothetical protein M3167_03590 [Acidobacteriota bacterium]|nr:hypothetical protein [Acidobacteriota bacterium]